MIYVIGDSHVHFYYLKGEIGFAWVGGGTAYNLVKEDSTTLARSKVLQFIAEKGADQKYVLMFGEVDCRAHICKHYVEDAPEKCEPFKAYVQPTIDRYFMFLDELWQRGLEVAPMTIPPAGSAHITPHQWVHLASAEVRRKIHECFNGLLREGCTKRGKACVDFYDKVVGADGLLRLDCTDDSCHLLFDVKVPLLVEELKRIGWLS